jgi:3-methylfumaryl-CoA hydratase
MRPLEVGSDVKRVSTIRDIAEKEGRSGRLVFVTVRHEVSDRQRPRALRRARHRLRGESALAAKPVPAPTNEKWHRDIPPRPGAAVSAIPPSRSTAIASITTIRT